MSEYNLDNFKEYCSELGMKLSPFQFEQFLSYYELLIEWNEKVNLTAVTDFDEVVIKHFIDSLSIIKVLDFDKPLSVMDVGTGAGFPGIPLKIAFPDTEVLLLDSLHKRINFLNTVIETLSLQNIKAVHGRAEDLARDYQYREQYDICVSRAVSNLATLSEYCIPFVKCGGIFVSYKSEKIKEEMPLAENAVRLLGGEIKNRIEFNLPGSDIYRILLVIGKIKKTSKKYPRKAGLPLKEPLL